MRSIIKRIVHAPSIAASEIEVPSVHHGARTCTGKFITVVRALHPRKTAEWLAAAAHCSVRAAKNYLSGRREWSGEAVNAIYRDVASRD